MFEVAVRELKDKQPIKTRRTLFLSAEPYERLQAYCRREKLSASEVIDAWIIKFLETAKK